MTVTSAAHVLGVSVTVNTLQEALHVINEIKSTEVRNLEVIVRQNSNVL